MLQFLRQRYNRNLEPSNLKFREANSMLHVNHLIQSCEQGSRNQYHTLNADTSQCWRETPGYNKYHTNPFHKFQFSKKII